MHSRYHIKRGIQHFKNAVKKSVLYFLPVFYLSGGMVKTIQSLVKKIQSNKNYPNFGKINPESSKNYPVAVKTLKIKFTVSYPDAW